MTASADSSDSKARRQMAPGADAASHSGSDPQSPDAITPTIVPETAGAGGLAARDLNDLAAGERAANFRHTREMRRTEVTEDYVELIADLIEQEGEARAVDIARRLGVSHATVVKTVTRLQQSGLVMSRPYRAIFLTEAGQRMAEESRRRHDIVLDFLRAIGVPEETAHADAEGMEHHCSRETLAAFARIIRERQKP